MTFLEAAKTVLRDAGEPLSPAEITRRALDRGLIETQGATPAATMSAQLTVNVRDLGAASEFTKVSRGVYGLREWGAAPDPQVDATPPRTPMPPTPRATCNYWLLATNPALYDVEELYRKGVEVWGEMITSAVSQKRIREQVRPGDRAFVYRTRPNADICCEVEVTAGPYKRGAGHAVDVRLTERFEQPVPLAVIRECEELSDLEFLGNTRVSVSHVTAAEYETVHSLIGEHSTGPEYSHDMIQCALIRIGRSFNLDIWIATDCQKREYNGYTFSDHTLSELPNVGFNPETVNLVRGIDVLWLRGSTIVAAFEIEHTTSIYSGLLRLADLVALQPNISIDLYVVAPQSRRSQVVKQLNRPTFHRLPRPLTSLCRYISYEKLTELAGRVEDLAGFLRPDLIRTVADDCTAP